ncbi:MAG: hypothetical protein AB8B97_14445 [Granulosicoccus sp.]
MKGESGESGDVGEPLTVLHIISGLQKGGGAEEILYRLVMENKHNRHVVMSLGDEGHCGPELQLRRWEKRLHTYLPGNMCEASSTSGVVASAV